MINREGRAREREAKSGGKAREKRNTLTFFSVGRRADLATRLEGESRAASSVRSAAVAAKKKSEERKEANDALIAQKGK